MVSRAYDLTMALGESKNLARRDLHYRALSHFGTRYASSGRRSYRPSLRRHMCEPRARSVRRSRSGLRTSELLGLAQHAGRRLATGAIERILSRRAGSRFPQLHFGFSGLLRFHASPCPPAWRSIWWRACYSLKRACRVWNGRCRNG